MTSGSDDERKYGVKILGRDLVPPFDVFWNDFASDIDVDVALIERGHQSVFGQECYREESRHLPFWMDLPDGALSYHVAHELTHIIMRKRGFPVSGRGVQYSEDSSESRVGGDLEEMVSHPALELILRAYPFDRTNIQNHLFESSQRGLENSQVPDASTPWWVTWACRFCELSFLLPQRTWFRLEVIYDGRCPDIASKGRELKEIMCQEGYGTSEQALQAMIRARDALGLWESGRCLVMDPRSGQVY